LLQESSDEDSEDVHHIPSDGDPLVLVWLGRFCGLGRSFEFVMLIAANLSRSERQERMTATVVDDDGPGRHDKANQKCDEDSSKGLSAKCARHDAVRV
jgi:hypothetical protein